MTDLAWIDAALTAARPQAVGALLRYFRDLDTAEEAFQDACLRALEELAGERPAARSRRLADPGRPQRRPRRRAPRGASRSRCPTEDSDLRPRRRRGRAGRAARRRALPRRHPAAAVHLLPSGAAGDPADRARAAHRLRPLGEADRPRLPGRRSGDGAAHHPRQAPHRRGATCPSRRPAPSSARSASPRSRR